MFCILLWYPGSDLWSQLQFSTGSWDFGEVEEGIRTGSDFEVENRGSTTYHVDVMSTCECLVLDPSHALIPPGERRSFQITFDSTGYSGSIQMDVIVRSDSPNLKKALFAVTGEVRSTQEGKASKDMMVQMERISGADLMVEYFYHPGCKECLEFILSIVPRLMEDLEYPPDFMPLDITEPLNYERLIVRLEQYGVELNSTPVCIIGATVLQGTEISASKVTEELTRFDRHNADVTKKSEVEKGTAADSSSSRQILSGISIPAVLTAGLLDGINPCAFATIIFLISALQIAGRNRTDIAFIGTSFTLAVFLSYYLIGLGVFNILRITASFAIISRLIEWLLILLLFVLAGFSLHDFFQSIRGNTGKILLQLPKTVKQRIHRTIRIRLRTAGLIIGSFSMGVLISLFELGCTGQIYLPIITYMVKTENNRGYLLLFVYNLAFILPLIAVMMAAYFGHASKRIADIFARNIPYVKLATSALFVIMAVGLVVL